MIKIFSPNQLAGWVSALCPDDDAVIVVGLTVDADVVGVQFVSTTMLNGTKYVDAESVGVAVEALSIASNDDWDKIQVAIMHSDDSVITKVEDYTYDVGNVLDLMKINWKNKTWVSDMCEDSGCCNPENPTSFAGIARLDVAE